MVAQKMVHSVLQLKSVVGVSFYIFTGVSEPEFQAWFTWAPYRYPFRLGKPSKTQKTYRLAQIIVHSVLQLKSVEGFHFTLSAVLRNQNFEPETTSHFTDTLSESKMAQQRKTFHFVFCNTSKKIVGSAQQTAVTCSPLGPKQCFSWSWDWIRRLLGWELTNPFWGNVSCK